MSLVLAGAAVIIFSLLAFWKANAIVFMIAGGSSLMLGLYWYDLYSTDLGLGIALMFIAYAFICLGLAFRCLFWKEDVLD